MKSSRISILDSFRAIAILSVMLYHFFSRWVAPAGQYSHYPYNDQYNYFGYGFLGVQFFFMISGFVIFKTLETTNTFTSFWLKRMIRLLPSMLIASVIIFIIFLLLDKRQLFPESHQWKNFLPGVTFFSPVFFNRVFHPAVQFNYLNGSFWSLWPEVQFYFLSSIIFYLDKHNFLRNFLTLSLFIIIGNWFIAHYFSSHQATVSVFQKHARQSYQLWIDSIFNLPKHLVYFAVGMIFSVLHTNKNLKKHTTLFIKLSFALLVLLMFYFGIRWQVRSAGVGMVAVFLCFIYYPGRLSLLENKLLARIGVASYFIYLIHENNGVIAINNFAGAFAPHEFIFPLLLIVIIIFIGIIYTQYIDVKINRFLKQKTAVSSPVQS